jgi:hypothetical protein
MKNLGILILFFAVLISCDSGEDKKTLKEANGRINHLLVVMKNSEWQGEMGDALRKILAEPVMGLPQPESLFEITQVPRESFGFTVASNVYAAPQRIITITGTNEAAIIEAFKKHSKEIITVFKDADLKSVQRKILKKYWDPTKIATFNKQGYSLKIPRNYRKVEDTGEFVWYRYHLDRGNSMELIAYSVPITSEDDENGNNIVAIRDAIGAKYIPGEIEGSHMITEEAYAPHIFEVTLDGKKTFETKGKWEVKGMYMAGPFISYTVVDKPNNRLVVVEGLTYAPSINKRDYMFELEAILKTLKID